MLTIVLLGPFVSSIINIVFGRLLGSSLRYLVLCMYFISSITSVLLVHNVIVNNSTIITKLFDWSTTLSTDVEVSVDATSVVILAVVAIIGTCVMSFSYYYMADDPKLNSFIGQLSGFVTFMMILTISHSLIVLFIGWELIGVYSYLLIGFWSDRVEANNGALSAMLTNKLGDYMLTFGLIALYATTCSFDFNIIDSLVTYTDGSDWLMTIVAVCMIVASMAKSAQIGLHLWLIHAMQGPTPVSSLLHAATLVVAGPILIFKLFTLITTLEVTWLVTIGITTSLLGALLAVIQSDIKAVIAYSTMSQFGYIISIASVASQAIGTLHIATHATFKCCLFIGAGVVIHSLSDVQDNRSYGGLIKLLPVAYVATLVSTLSLIAIPYTSGSISKDLILEVHAAQYALTSNYAFYIGCLVAMITSLYSVRLLIITYMSTANTSRGTVENLHTANGYALSPMILLSMLAISIGYYALPYVIDSMGYNDTIIIAEIYSIDIKLVPVVAVIIGILLAIMWYRNDYQLKGHTYRALVNRLYWPTMYTSLYMVYLRLGYGASKLIDNGILELIGPRGMSKLWTI